jgi:rhomboid protease GluP
MFRRQTSGSTICPSCRSLVGVNDEVCLTCGRRNPGLWGFGPVLKRAGANLGFVEIVTVGCAALYVVSLLLTGPAIQMRGVLSLLSPSGQSLYILGASGAVPVFEMGRWWTLLSAAWLHGSLLHILFNMMWVRQLAPATEEAFGTSRMVIVYTVSSAAGFLLSSLAGQYLWWMPLSPLRGGALSVGASAPIFGLLGALVLYGSRAGSSMVHQQAKFYAVIMGVFGLLLPGVDNYAHLGGFLGGYLVARWMDPLHPERGDHAMMALACVGLTAASVLASVYFALAPWFGLVG